VRRFILPLAFAVFVAAVVTVVVVLTGITGDRKVTPFPTAVATAPPTPPNDSFVTRLNVWPVYGYDQAHTFSNPISRQWPPYRVKWQLDVGDLLEFPPITWGDRLYFNAGHGFVYCCRASTGKVLWRFNTAGKLARQQ
jgi:hypothetical protein